MEPSWAISEVMTLTGLQEEMFQAQAQDMVLTIQVKARKKCSFFPLLCETTFIAK